MNMQVTKKRNEEMKSLEIEQDAYNALEDAIVPWALLDSLEGVTQDIKRLEAQEDLKPHQQEDLRHYKEYAPALATVIEWWTAQGSPERRKLEELTHG